MTKSVLNVEGMACEHCSSAVKTAVGALAGIASVDVNLSAKSVTVEYDDTQITIDKIAEAIEDHGYDVV